MERCEVCADEIKSSIFKGTKVCCQICRKIRQRKYSWATARDQIARHFPMERQAKAFQYIKFHYGTEE